MKLQRASQRGHGVRILITGDLQYSMSEETRKEFMISCWHMNPEMIEELDLSREDQTLIQAESDRCIRGNWYIEGYHRPHGWIDMEQNALESLLCAEFSFIRPEEIGALTDAPILAERVYSGDTGDDERDTDWDKSLVWWYPNYCLRSFVEDLILTGETIFTKAE